MKTLLRTLLVVGILFGIVVPLMATAPDGEPITVPPPHTTTTEVNYEDNIIVYQVDTHNLQHDLSHWTLRTCTNTTILECGTVEEGVYIPGTCEVGKDPTTETEWGIIFEEGRPVNTITDYYIRYGSDLYLELTEAVVKFGPYTWADPVQGVCGDPNNVDLLTLEAREPLTAGVSTLKQAISFVLALALIIVVVVAIKRSSTPASPFRWK